MTWVIIWNFITENIATGTDRHEDRLSPHDNSFGFPTYLQTFPV